MIFNATSGSNSLNFKVIASAAEPSNPKTNTIWVKTSIAIPYWTTASGDTTPTWNAVQGNVVFWWKGVTASVVNSATSAGFLAIKANSVKGNLYLLPVSCYQQVGDGTAANWQSVNAYIYKSGGWVQFSSEFAATIKVTYPAGSYVWCFPGTSWDDWNESTSLVGDTSGSYTFVVPSTGTWFIGSRTDDWSQFDSTTVSITTDGQSASVTLSYFDGYLYNYGSVNTDVTGGWKSDGDGSVTAQDDGSVRIAPTTGRAQAIYHTVNKVNLSNYSTLTMNGKMWEQNAATDGWYRTYICVWSAVTYGSYTTGLVASTNSDSNAVKDHTLDVSSLTGSYYIGIAAIDHPNYGFITMNTMKLT